MNSLDLSDIQGYVIRGYRFPVACFVFAKFERIAAARAFVRALLPKVTTAALWENGKPDATLNIAFTYSGLSALGLPATSLVTFPVEFQQGMKVRADILNDIGANAPERWDALWKNEVHAWIAIHAQTPAIREAEFAQLEALARESGAVTLAGRDDGGLLFIDGKPTAKEHFGYTDGIGNPDFDGAEKDAPPGRGKLALGPGWKPLATGEFLLGYADEAEELPPAPWPDPLAKNSTFMVYRKLRQNVSTFREYLDEMSSLYDGGKEKLAAKLVGRWRDGTPLELSPESADAELAADTARNNDFSYSADTAGTRCPFGAHIRRTNPRNAAGFNGALSNRRRVIRRGLPYGSYVPEGQPIDEAEERGILFMALNASIFRQFEFVQQQWVEYGNDAHQGNDKDPLSGNHGGSGRFVVQGDADEKNPPFICGHLPTFVELRGGDYFFMPGLTALRMIAAGMIDPR